MPIEPEAISAIMASDRKKLNNRRAIESVSIYWPFLRRFAYWDYPHREIFTYHQNHTNRPISMGGRVDALS
jgi:hypothetical protein